MPSPSSRRQFLRETGCFLAALGGMAPLASASPRRRITRRTTRRAAGAAAAAAAAPVVVPRAKPKPEPKTMPIVDTHQHLWDLTKFKLPWTKDEPKLAKNFVMSDYLAATSGLNVTKTVYMEVDVDPTQQDKEIAYVSQLCEARDNPMRAAVVSGRPAAPDFADYLKRHKNNPWLRGIRQVLHNPETPAGFCLEPAFVEGVRKIGEQGWCFDLCMRSYELADAAKLIEQCPGTRFVLDHCGNASVLASDLSGWRTDMTEIAAKPNVIGKVSGVIATGAGGKWTVENLAPIVNHTLDVFGPDRVVFGGDWPVCTLAASFKEWVDALKTIVADRPQEEQRKLFYDNAVKFYRLT